MVRRGFGKGVAAVLLAVAISALPGLAGGADFDLSKFNQELGLRFAYGKNTHGATVHLYSLLPRWGIFFLKPGKQLGPFGASFVVEGIMSIAGAEETGFELGFTPMLKLSCLVFPGVLAYVEGGAGMMTKHQQPCHRPCLQFYSPGGGRLRHRLDRANGLFRGLPFPPLFQRRAL